MDNSKVRFYDPTMGLIVHFESVFSLLNCFVKLLFSAN